jgi:hypothetical protein
LVCRDYQIQNPQRATRNPQHCALRPNSSLDIGLEKSNELVFMLIYNDIFAWEGFGGRLRIGAGTCRLKIYDLRATENKGLAHLRPFIVIAADIAESRMSVRSCVSHIATSVAKEFKIDPQRMLFLEYYPEATYGRENEKHIPERYDAVDFQWHGDKALHPKWRSVRPPLLDLLRELMREAVDKR